MRVRREGEVGDNLAVGGIEFLKHVVRNVGMRLEYRNAKTCY